MVPDPVPVKNQTLGNGGSHGMVGGMNRVIGLSVMACGLLLGGCASVSVMSETPLSEESPTRLPDRIFVQPFEYEEGVVRVDRSGRELSEFKRELQEKVAKDLAVRMGKYIAPAVVLAPGEGVPHGNYWLVSGRFTRVNQGSRFLRSAFGLGLGGTKMEVDARVSDLEDGNIRPLLGIKTSGGSNAYPGAILGIINWTLILSGADGLLAGLTSDGRRTAREISYVSARYLQSHGVVLKNDAPRPKYKGRPSWWPEKD